MRPNIIFPAACILLGADMCGISHATTAGKRSIGESLVSTQAKGPDESKSDTLGVTSLSGRGAMFNLGGDPYGVFVSTTKEAFIIKLPSADGWMQLVEPPQQDGQGRQIDISRVRYNAVPDPCIIKVDDSVLEQFTQKSSSNENISWRDIEFYYKKAIGDSPIFTKDGIRSSTEFTISSVNHLTSNRLSISGSVASTTFKELEKVGFVLVKKDTSGLIHLVKNILEGGTEWSTKAKVTADYITCPAALDGDVLQFDSSDVALPLQDVRLEDYAIYCYLKDGEYSRLIQLENIKSLVEESPEKRYCWNQVVRAPKNGTAAIPRTQPDRSGDTNDGQSNINGVHVNGAQTDPITNSSAEQSTPDANHTINNNTSIATNNTQTSPMQITENAELVPPTPTVISPQKPTDSVVSESSPNKQEAQATHEHPDNWPPPPSPDALMHLSQDASSAQNTTSINTCAAPPLPPINGPLEPSKTVHTSSRQVISSQNSENVQNRQPASNGSENGSIPPPPPIPSGSGSVPPPPPLPLMSKSCSNINGSNEGNGHFLDQTRQGKNLKKCEPDPKPGNPHDALMADIREGNKKVDYNERTIEERIAANKTQPKDQGDIAQAILKSSRFQAMVRANQTNSNDDDDDNDDDNADQWEG
ncbi:hypothetical protein [Cardinium endosymbiont of Oedothorax gibbosus]|uniref:hypothetical protein n=1 Tax=Cardinium endosymbiont of Oedothorax gibbosus TaxID=931101 RepID=UPI00202431AD|nr:hypothetical protein [Cardinium endosymbiont of Oedothorax gibbosus]